MPPGVVLRAPWGSVSAVCATLRGEDVTTFLHILAILVLLNAAVVVARMPVRG